MAQSPISAGRNRRAGPRRRGLHIPRFAQKGKARSFHRSASPTQTRFAGLCVRAPAAAIVTTPPPRPPFGSFPPGRQTPRKRGDTPREAPPPPPACRGAGGGGGAAFQADRSRTGQWEGASPSPTGWMGRHSSAEDQGAATWGRPPYGVSPPARQIVQGNTVKSQPALPKWTSAALLFHIHNFDKHAGQFFNSLDTSFWVFSPCFRSVVSRSEKCS